MKRILLKLEFKKAFDSRLLWIVLAVGILIAGAAACTAISRYHYSLQEAAYLQSRLRDGVILSPELGRTTVFNKWIGQNYNVMEATLFYTLLPILASLSFGGSYYSERTNGYVKNIFTRTSKKDYYLAKYTTVFILGAFVVVVPMMINLMLVSSFVPAYRPDLYYDIYYAAYPENFASKLFYERPWAFVGLRLIEAGMTGGLAACSSVAASFFMKNRFAVLLLPFLVLISISYIADMLGIYTSVELSPLSFIHGGSEGNPVFGVILAYAAGAFALSFGITMWRGVKDDVF